MIMKDVFKTYFDRYDTNGVYHNGFIQSIDLTSYVDFTFINDLSSAIVDSYLFNEFSNRVVLDRWKKYMRWDAVNKRFIIDPAFYTNAVNALYVYLSKSEKFFSILSQNFSSLTANETEVINYGSRTRANVYGEQTIGRAFDKVVVELSRGTETENKGTHTDSETREQFKDSEKIGARSDSESIGGRSDSESIGAQTNGTNRTEKIHPFDSNTFVDDTQTVEEISNGAQANTTTIGAQSNSTTTGEQNNETTHGEQRKQNIFGAQVNSKEYGKTTNETKEREDAETRGAHTDNETISAYIDQKTRTKVLILSPDKYFEIQKELADKNIYTLFADAVKDCFLSDVFEFQALENGGIIL